MAITTLTGFSTGAWQQFSYAKSGLPTASALNNPVFLWFLSAGTPRAGTGASTLSGTVIDSSDVGAIPFKNPSSGNTYLSKWEMPSPINFAAASALLVDLLWVSSTLSQVTTTQTINSITFPNRDINGASDGAGVYVALYHNVTYVAPLSAYTATISYTNSANAPSRTGTLSQNGGNSTRSYFFSLDDGDVGVKSIQSFTFSALPGATGTSLLLAFRPIALLTSVTGSGGMLARESAVTLAAPRIYDSSALTFFVFNATAQAGITLSQG